MIRLSSRSMAGVGEPLSEFEHVAGDEEAERNRARGLTRPLHGGAGVDLEGFVGELGAVVSSRTPVFGAYQVPGTRHVVI
ncbi:hypothetical protein [Sorangium sp. So ce388]|uniref:hypothetical protein n=1 Tax=Sorangium sp. So ce388 TaxID=3133309 RepID=UPI003F5C8D30